MKKTKIDWCDCTVNPVVGCKNGCEYCYAKKINDRFKIVPDFKKPQFFPERLKQFESKAPKSVFIDSMSDIANWKQAWFDETMEAIHNNPQHKYIALTKNVAELRERLWLYFCKYTKVQPCNLFVGKTITQKRNPSLKPLNVDFLSIEPLLEPIDIIPYIDPVLKTVIIGAETGNRKQKVIPKKQWVEDIVDAATIYGVGIFMKESLRGIMGEDFRQDKLPWQH